jgi:sec-independent protein translocase protein TatA
MGLGPFHLLALIVIILIFFGPSRLPGLGKSVGEAIRGFKKGMEGDEIDVTPVHRETLNASEQDPITQKKKEKSRSDS